VFDGLVVVFYFFPKFCDLVWLLPFALFFLKLVSAIYVEILELLQHFINSVDLSLS
jgi:hypothetical protein